MLVCFGFALGMTSTLVGYQCEANRASLPARTGFFRGVRFVASMFVLAPLFFSFLGSWGLPIIAIGSGVGLHWL
jgi:hypothetical protein